jgi:hypothetical protein
MSVAPADQVSISNFHETGISYLRILAMKPIVQNPWNIVPVNDPENERPLERQTLGHGGDSDIAAS